MVKAKHTDLEKSGKAQTGSTEAPMIRTFDTGDEFSRGFLALLTRAGQAGTLSPEAQQAVMVLFDVLRDALVDGDSSGVIATTARLVQTEDGRKRYTRRKGAAALDGWMRVLWQWVPRIQAEQGEKHLAEFLPGLLQRYDDRALELEADTVLEVVDRELSRGAPITKAAIVSIAARLATNCEAFGHKVYRTSRSTFEKVAMKW